MVGQGNLKSQGKGEEFENLWQRQSSENLHVLFKGKENILKWVVQAHLQHHWGILLKKRICSLEEQFLSFKSSTQFQGDIVCTVEVKIKTNFGSVKRICKTVKCQRYFFLFLNKNI